MMVNGSTNWFLAKVMVMVWLGVATSQGVLLTSTSSSRRVKRRRWQKLPRLLKMGGLTFNLCSPVNLPMIMWKEKKEHGWSKSYRWGVVPCSRDRGTSRWPPTSSLSSRPLFTMMEPMGSQITWKITSSWRTCHIKCHYMPINSATSSTYGICLLYTSDAADE